jgi:hypothetical protein
MKKTLLMAAAALAAGVITSQAQVYSQNIVGYVNVPAPIANRSYLITCPLTIGASNGLNEVFGSSLPANTKLLIWNGVNNYDIALYDPTDPNGDGSGPWFQGDDATVLSPLPTIRPGKGFFIVPAAPMTNVFAGAVVVNAGSSNVINFATANLSYLVGGAIPYGGVVTNGSSIGGGMNLNGIAANTKLLIWNGINNYDIALYDPTDPNGDGSGPWFLGDDATPIATPNVNVGQGFFIVPSAAYKWTNGLPTN